MTLNRIAATLLLLFVCALKLEAQQDVIIKLAVHVPLTQGDTIQGRSIRNSAILAVEQLGAPLRDQGFDVQLVEFDDQGNPDVAVANAEQIVADPEILGVVGHFNSGVAIPASEIYDVHELVLISPAITNPLVTDRGLLTVNRISGRDDAVGAVGAEIVADRGVATTYIVHDRTTFGEGVSTFYRNNAFELGVTVLGFEGAGEDNTATLVTSIIDAAPGAVYLGGTSTVMGPLVRQLHEAGYRGLFIGPDGLDTPVFAELGGDAAIGAVYVTTAGPASVFRGAEQFIEDYVARFSESPPPYAAEAYDATGILLTAIERGVEVNNGVLPTREQVAQEARDTTDYDGITGVISFDNNGDRASAYYFVLEVVSSNPAQWSQNRVIDQLEIVSPLTAEQAESSTFGEG